MLFHVRPVSLLVPTTILTTLLTAFAMLVFERPVQHIVGSGIIDWATSVWCTVVTLSTVRARVNLSSLFYPTPRPASYSPLLPDDFIPRFLLSELWLNRPCGEKHGFE